MLYKLSRFIFVLYFKILYRWHVYGKENIPRQGPFIICSNHISWFDPPLVASSIPAGFTVHFMAKEELFRSSLAGKFLRAVGAFPVKRDTVDYAAIRTSFRLLKKGSVLGMFPEGTRSKNGRIQKAHNGAAMIAVRSETPIVPVAIAGPYQIGRPLKVYIGPAYHLTLSNHGDDKKGYERLSCEIMERIKTLLPAGEQSSAANAEICQV